jgi:hypothetical protein
MDATMTTDEERTRLKEELMLAEDEVARHAERIRLIKQLREDLGKAYPPGWAPELGFTVFDCLLPERLRSSEERVTLIRAKLEQENEKQEAEVRSTGAAGT